MNWKPPWRRPIVKVVEDHTHDWKVTGGTYAPPPGKVRAFGFIDNRTESFLLRGETTLTQECKICHRVNTTPHAGRVDLSKYGLVWERNS
jgi:hypothetical protein